MTQILLVGLGGMVGSIGRFLLSGFVQRFSPIVGFPFGTLVVNVIGCFVIGLLNGVADTRQLFGNEFRLFLFIGVLGGFTTYSTFGYETLSLLRDAEFHRAVLSIGLHLIVGLGAVWAGDALGRLS
ncbi:MAG: fluoride efflux transporter CrcB [Nitrospirales bacterium]|nr:fluoride efflux transporter CrcB [Nitrospira sp.]MDR4501638.1 fluoride efflux transporter CrcB [Nitrospirales bacterium]